MVYYIYLFLVYSSHPVRVNFCQAFCFEENAAELMTVEILNILCLAVSKSHGES